MRNLKSWTPGTTASRPIRKPLVTLSRTLSSALLIFSLLMPAFLSCKKDQTSPTKQSYAQTNLVSDTAGYTATRVDANLKNAWGIAIGSTGSIWISANHTGTSPVYDRNGAQLLPAVTVDGGSPTGVVFNSTSGFKGSKFIYANEDGTISAWTSGGSTVMVADRSSSGAVYKGLAIATDGGADFLYVANFKGNNIDVFDTDFNFVTTKLFDDPTIPEGFAPFNIYNHDGKLYVMYAKLLGPDNQDDQKGVGNGYVNNFNADGTMVERFASQGTLNSPWGLVDAPSGFGLGSDILLVGNFGDGKINVFTSDGTYKGQLENDGRVIVIDGLWALVFPENGVPAGDQNQLFFTAGPADETHGLFGYLSLK